MGLFLCPLVFGTFVTAACSVHTSFCFMTRCTRGVSVHFNHFYFFKLPYRIFYSFATYEWGDTGDGCIGISVARVSGSDGSMTVPGVEEQKGWKRMVSLECHRFQWLWAWSIIGDGLRHPAIQLRQTEWYFRCKCIECGENVLHCFGFMECCKKREATTKPHNHTRHNHRLLRGRKKKLLLLLISKWGALTSTQWIIHKYTYSCTYILDCEQRPRNVCLLLLSSCPTLPSYYGTFSVRRPPPHTYCRCTTYERTSPLRHAHDHPPLLSTIDTAAGSCATGKKKPISLIQLDVSICIHFINYNKLIINKWHLFSSSHITWERARRDASIGH